MKCAQTFLTPFPGILIVGVKDPPGVLVGTGVLVAAGVAVVDDVDKVDVVVAALKAEVRAVPVKEEKKDILQSPPHFPLDPSPPHGVWHSDSATFFP